SEAALGVLAPELTRLAALAGSEATARLRKLKKLTVTKAFRFNDLSFRPSAHSDMPDGSAGRGRTGWPIRRAGMPDPPPTGRTWQRTHSVGMMSASPGRLLDCMPRSGS